MNTDSATALKSARTAAKPLLHNPQGQKLGRKGRITRERILVAAAKLIRESDDLQLSLSAIAREAGIGMTSLYNYFADITEVLIALLEQAMVGAEETYLAHLRTRWSDESLAKECQVFLEGFAQFWAQNANLPHLRNNVADQRDQRMIEHRVTATKEIISLLVAQMDGEFEGGDGTAHSISSTLYMGIERSISVSNNPDLPSNLPGPLRPDIDKFLGAHALLLDFGIRKMRRQNAT